MTSPLLVKQDINQRVAKLSVSLAEAQRFAAKNVPPSLRTVANDSGDERELLRIEKQAKLDKALNKRSEQTYNEGIRDLVHQSLTQRLEGQLSDQTLLFQKILGFDQALPSLLDALSVRASTISKLEPQAANIPWLYDELLRFVNQPKYRRTDARGKPIIVDSLRVALSFIGIENLKMVIPSLAFKRLLPQITDPYPEIKTRMWQMSLGTALCAKKLAGFNNVDENLAFTLGMFHEIGRIVITRLYFRLFDQVQREALLEAHQAKLKDEYSALTKIQPSGDFLLSLMDTYANDISVSMVEQMNFRRVMILPALSEYARALPLTKMSPLALTLTQSRAYCHFRLLRQYRMINKEEAKSYLRYYRFPAGAITALKHEDISQLNLNLNET